MNTTALNAVALSSVAKYWVLTNLLPGPIPQVSVYGLPGTGRNDAGGKSNQVTHFYIRPSASHSQCIINSLLIDNSRITCVWTITIN